MLDAYVFPISYAFLTFPIAALLFTLPFLIVQYRRHGYIHKFRALVLYLLLLYLMNAFYLIILPLPASIHNLPPKAATYFQTIPFNFVEDIARETTAKLGSPSTYVHLLKERAFLQVLFNVLLLVPFGMFLRYYFRAGWVKCLVMSFGLSFFFEITQVSGIYGIYDYPYRLFDVDDLIANTFGGMVGFVLAEWVSKLLPRMDRLDAGVDLTTKRVTYTRRGIAFFFDWCIVFPISAFLAVAGLSISYVIVVVLYFIVLPYLTNGRTLGKWIVRIHLKGKGDRIGLKELVIRYGLLYVLIGGLNVLFVFHVQDMPNIFGMLYGFGLFIMNIWFGIHCLRCLFNRNRELFYERKSGTKHVISVYPTKLGNQEDEVKES